MSLVDLNLLDVAVMAQEDNKVEMEVFCKWNNNFCSDWLEWNKWSTSEGRPFVPGNFHLICLLNLHFNQ